MNELNERDNKERLRTAKSYVNRIRNPEKRRYGQCYLRYIRFGESLNEDSFDCSFMAKQAVRLAIAEIMEPFAISK